MDVTNINISPFDLKEKDLDPIIGPSVAMLTLKPLRVSRTVAQTYIVEFRAQLRKVGRTTPK